ncbi:DUF2061 domain-containing protein [Roseivivax marinus]|uniref:DUF2061 domain-containing protein n=1 Tax=Roseivivax marinus TaxID=1379903 RepID=UPI0008D1095B|nr:DUF2061 domain-containing protein [Roseivivax marinus]UMA64073.1 DUF2061 domain-containing protein [Roseivivax marinus]SEK34651.1 Uncharacterized membrane protein [Roseivivax marinus]
METRARTWVKAIGWQVLGIAVMTLLGVLVTGSVGAGGTLALASAGLGLITYVLYERLWARITWGRLPGPSGTGDI